MSDGMSDARNVGLLATAVEACAGNLVRSMYHARSGHRGIAIEELATANEVLQLHGLRLVAEHDYADRIERSAKVLRW